MEQNNNKPNARKTQAGPATSHADTHLDRVNTQDAYVVDADMLFEATEALVHAISLQNASTEQDAILGAIHSEALAPFDGRDVLEAERFLRRMGYLSREPHITP